MAELGYPPTLTLHGLRAGWASWRYAIGQGFDSLREDGLWRSDDCLRVYIDVISAATTDASESEWLGLVQHLGISFHQWLLLGAVRSPPPPTYTGTENHS